MEETRTSHTAQKVRTYCAHLVLLFSLRTVRSKALLMLIPATNLPCAGIMYNRKTSQLIEGTGLEKTDRPMKKPQP